MKPLKLSVLAEWLQTTPQGKEVTVTGISTDTRTLVPGDLFVAIKGEQVDSHDCLKEAEMKGAVAAIVSEAVETPLSLLKVSDTVSALGEIAHHYRQQFKLPIVSITGSCGKTTVKEMLASILAVRGPMLANQGNLNTEVGVPLTLLRLEDQHQTAVVEMGARKGGDIRYLMQIASPAVTLITNAGVAHIEIFGSERGIAEAKGEIYAHLDPQGIAVMNIDEPHFTYWQSLLKGQSVITFGFQPTADVTAYQIAHTAMDSVFTLKTPEGSIQIQLSAPGKHNIANALSAAAAGVALGFSLTDIQQGLEAFVPVSGRLQIKLSATGIRIIDDTYNANPQSVKAALDVLSAFQGHKIFVMGDMLELGNDSLQLHRDIGVYARQLGISQMMGIGKFTQAAIEGFGESGQHYPSKAKLIQDLLLVLDKQDQSGKNENTVLIKGSRSMRMEEIVAALLKNSKEKNPC